MEYKLHQPLWAFRQTESGRSGARVPTEGYRDFSPAICPPRAVAADVHFLSPSPVKVAPRSDEKRQQCHRKNSTQQPNSTSMPGNE